MILMMVVMDGLVVMVVVMGEYGIGSSCWWWWQSVESINRMWDELVSGSVRFMARRRRCRLGVAVGGDGGESG